MSKLAIFVNNVGILFGFYKQVDVAVLHLFSLEKWCGHIRVRTIFISGVSLLLRFAIFAEPIEATFVFVVSKQVRFR